MRIPVILLTLFLGTHYSAVSQIVSTSELLTILDIKTYRLPSFAKKQWTIEIIPDTLQQRQTISINRILNSKTTSLVATKLDNDTTLSFTLIQNKDVSSKGDFRLKSARYEISWNNFPEYLYKNTFVIGMITYEQNEEHPLSHLTDLLIVELIDELKF